MARMIGMRWLLLSSLLLGWCATSVHAEVYKWTDANGRVHFSDKPPPRQADQLPEVEVAARRDLAIRCS